MKKIFIDGREGTTGIQLVSRLMKIRDIDLLVLPDELRKDMAYRREMVNISDFVFLCLPDEAAEEAVSLIENTTTRVIDASTLHRTQEGWTYGFPELSAAHREAIIGSNRVSVPGCHASGFESLIYPLVAAGAISDDYPVVATSITGYSGGGKKMIAEYEKSDNKYFLSPRQYGLTQLHKHLPEMQKITGLNKPPMFQPYVCNYYSGMEVSVSIDADLMKTKLSLDGMYDLFKSHYNGQSLISVEKYENAFMPANLLAGKDNMKIFISGNDERILLSSVFDNLGKGASGAAVQCFNIMTGQDETTGLVI